MNILVTGGAGYLGSHLVKKLLDYGHSVTLLDNFLYGSNGIKNIKDNKNVNIINGDICNIKDVVKAVKHNDVAIALAAIVGDPACNLDEEETLSTNYEATKVLIEICNFYRVKRLIFASSCSVYGANDNFLNESSPTNPISLYARTRIMSEEIIMKNSRNGPVSTIFRMGTLYGTSQRMRFDLSINFMTAKALIDGACEVFGGDQWRPFIHVEDAAEAYVKAISLEPEIIDKEIFNVGFSEQNMKIYEIGNAIKTVFPDINVINKRDLIDHRDYKVNFDKFASNFKLHPRHTVQSAIKEISQFVKDNNTKINDDIYYNVKYIYKER